MRARTASVALVVALGGLLAGCGDGTEEGDESRDRAPGSARATSGTESPSDEPTPAAPSPAEVARLMRTALAGPVTAEVEIETTRGSEPFLASGSAGFGGATPVLDVEINFRTDEEDGTYLVEGGTFTLQGPDSTPIPSEGPVGQVNPWGTPFANADPVLLSYMVEAFGRSVEVGDGPDGAMTYDVGVRPRPVLQLIGYDVSQIDPMGLPREYFVNIDIADDGRLSRVRSDFDQYGFGLTTFSRWRQLSSG